MTGERVPPLAVRPLEQVSRCDICGKGRSSGKHTACSKKRQAKHAGKWEAHKQAVAAAKAKK